MRPNWMAFVVAQRESCVALMKALGLGEAWLQQIPSFLDSVDLRPPAEGVLLHTEIMRDHLLVEQRSDGWRLTGLLDFEPAMVGDPEYELASAAVFLTGGNFDAFRAFLRGCGIPESDQTPDLARRILAYQFLHRHGNLAWHLTLLPSVPRRRRSMRLPPPGGRSDPTGPLPSPASRRAKVRAVASVPASRRVSLGFRARFPGPSPCCASSET